MPLHLVECLACRTLIPTDASLAIMQRLTVNLNAIACKWRHAAGVHVWVAALMF